MSAAMAHATTSEGCRRIATGITIRVLAVISRPGLHHAVQTTNHASIPACGARAGRKAQLLMPPTQTLHGTARSQSLELERTEPGEPCTFVDLLAAVRAASVAELDLARVLVLNPMQVGQLRRIAKRHIEDNRLRHQLVELINLTERPGGGRP